MPAEGLIFILGAYLLGSVPSAYLLARWRRGIDIREFGSGNVGGSNLRGSVGLWATVAVGLLDVAKGAAPVLLGRAFGLGATAVVVAGIAAVVGHNWSLWLRFQGGRGMATTLGVLLVTSPTGVLWVLVFLAFGRMIGQVSLMNGLGVLMLPVLSAALCEPALINWMTAMLVLLMIAKRLEANQRFKPYSRCVWLERLLYDRDPV